MDEDHDMVWLRINDGSCVANLQVMVESSVFPLDRIASPGTSILAEGVIEKPTVQSKHVVELNLKKILHVGTIDTEKYPLVKAKLSFDSIRSYPHFRPRTTMVASITRIRNRLTYAAHQFFHSTGFFHVHMLIITTTNPRNDSQMFQVATSFSKSNDMEEVGAAKDKDAINLEIIRSAIKEKSNKIEELKRSDSNKEALITALQDIQKANELALHLEEKKRATAIRSREVNSSENFFSRQAYLSISAGLHLETYASALSSVYTFGPTFQAEGSQPMKHLAETRTVEVEMAFAELEISAM